jgi:WD40 repeat protein/predicted Ser/Thr protein kinase
MNELPRDSSNPQGNLTEVIAAYLEAAAAGQAPDREQLLAQHPHLADQLRRFFSSRGETLPQTLASAPAAGNVGATPTVDSTPGQSSHSPGAPPAPGIFPARFGDYEIEGELARGGMGVVYRAHQRSANRTVALKMILARELASEGEVRRFRREAELAANLDHPNIVPIYEVGEYHGQHFFSMKLIEGGSLADHLPRYAADPRAAAALVARVARAVHHAHQRGVLHRDLKPGNILLDGAGDPHVTDFGLAKKTEAGALTQTGAILGTPEYMAPEQAAAGVVTTAADVYGLGAVLYALLTGQPPFHADNLLDTLRQVLERDPPSLRPQNSRIDRDLETICLKCLHKDPGKRYASAEALADDLDRWLTGQPILARPVGRVERLVLLVRRRPVVAGLLAVIVVVAAAGLGAFIWQYQDALEQKQVADSERKVALQRAGEIEDKSNEIARNLRELGEKNREISDRIAAEKEARKQSELRYQTLRQTTVNARLIEAVSLAADRPGKARRLLEDTDSFPLDLRDFAWAYHRGQLKREPALVTPANGPGILWHAFSPDGKLLAWRASDGGTQVVSSRAVTLWDVEGRSVRASLAHKGEPISAAAFSPDGKLLATGARAGRGGIVERSPTEVKVWEAATGREVRSLAGLPAAVDQLAFSPDGKLLAIGMTFPLGGPSPRSAEVRVWEPAAGSKTHSWQGAIGGVTALAFSPDGQRLAAVTAMYGSKGKMGLFDTASRSWRSLGDVPLGATALAFSPDGKWLAVGGAWDQSQPAPEPGAALAGGRLDVWDLSKEPDRPVIRRAAHRRAIIGVAFTPDSKGLVSWDSTSVAFQGKPAPADAPSVKLWQLPTERERLSIPFTNGSPYAGRRLALSDDCTRVAVKYGDEVQVWDLAAGQQKGSFKTPSMAPSALAFSPDGQTLFATDQQDVVVLDGRSLAERDRLPIRPPLTPPARRQRPVLQRPARGQPRRLPPGPRQRLRGFRVESERGRLRVGPSAGRPGRAAAARAPRSGARPVLAAVGRLHPRRPPPGRCPRAVCAAFVRRRGRRDRGVCRPPRYARPRLRRPPRRADRPAAGGPVPAGHSDRGGPVVRRPSPRRRLLAPRRSRPAAGRGRPVGSRYRPQAAHPGGL